MTAYKFGRLPGVVPVGLKDLTFYAAGWLPKPPASAAVPSVPAQDDGTPWGVGGNDEYGDCGVIGLDHGFMAVAADTSENESFPAVSEVVDYYFTYTGGQDSGVVLSDFLAYVKANGFYGHTVQAYAPVSVRDIRTLQFATWAYDFCYTGIQVTQAMMDAFGAGEPWTLDAALDSPIGGHCVPIVGYDSAWLYLVTWGKVQKLAYSAWHHIAEEAWAVLVGEEVAAGTDGHGLNLAALQADLNRLGR